MQFHCFICATNSAIAALLSDEEVAGKIEILRQGINTRTEAARAMDPPVRQRHSDAVVVDMLIPGTPGGYVEGTVADYEAMGGLPRETGFTAVTGIYNLETSEEWLQQP